MDSTPQTAPIALASGASGAPSSKPTIRNPAPPELADVALIDAPRIAAAACMSLSAWYVLVRRGQAPQPAIRAPRCTRWRLADVRAWLAQRAEQGSSPQATLSLVTNARRASAAALAKRQAARSTQDAQVGA